MQQRNLPLSPNTWGLPPPMPEERRKDLSRMEQRNNPTNRLYPPTPYLQTQYAWALGKLPIILERTNVPGPSLFMGPVINVTDIYVWTPCINNRKGDLWWERKDRTTTMIQPWDKSLKNTFWNEAPSWVSVWWGFETEKNVITVVVFS